MRYILFILLGMICSLAHAEETFKNPIFYQPLKSWAHGFRSTIYLTPTTSRIVGDGYDTLIEGCVLIEDTGSSIILGCPHYAGTMYERYVNVGNPNRAQRKALMERDWKHYCRIYATQSLDLERAKAGQENSEYLETQELPDGSCGPAEPDFKP